MDYTGAELCPMAGAMVFRMLGGNEEVCRETQYLIWYTLLCEVGEGK